VAQRFEEHPLGFGPARALLRLGKIGRNHDRHDSIPWNNSVVGPRAPHSDVAVGGDKGPTLYCPARKCVNDALTAALGATRTPVLSARSAGSTLRGRAGLVPAALPACEVPAMSDVLSQLVELLSLEPIEVNLFRGQSQDLGWGQVFG